MDDVTQQEPHHLQLAITFRKELAHLVRESRKAKKLTQYNAAKKIGLDHRHYQNIEGGKINVRLDTVMLLAEFYGLKVALTGETAA